jgi:hypothetical protein
MSIAYPVRDVGQIDYEECSAVSDPELSRDVIFKEPNVLGRLAPLKSSVGVQAPQKPQFRVTSSQRRQNPPQSPDGQVHRTR